MYKLMVTQGQLRPLRGQLQVTQRSAAGHSEVSCRSLRGQLQVTKRSAAGH